MYMVECILLLQSIPWRVCVCFCVQIEVVVVDVSTTLKTPSSTDHSNISNEEVLSNHPDGHELTISSLGRERNEALATLSLALVHLLKKSHSHGKLAGAIGVGGSGGTALIAPALRALPLGVPKVLISTVASGNTAAYVKTTDLVLFPSVVDIAGSAHPYPVSLSSVFSICLHFVIRSI